MKIYMAGPLFTLAERLFNSALADCLRARGHDVLLPQEADLDEYRSAERLFFHCTSGIEWCDVVVACMDGPDPDSGTCFECGLAYTARPVVAYRTDLRDIDDGYPPFNLMLTQSANCVINGKFKSTEVLAELICGEIEKVFAT